MKDIYLLDADDTLLDFKRGEREKLQETFTDFGVKADCCSTKSALPPTPPRFRGITFRSCSKPPTLSTARRSFCGR